MSGIFLALPWFPFKNRVANAAEPPAGDVPSELPLFPRVKNTLLAHEIIFELNSKFPETVGISK